MQIVGFGDVMPSDEHPESQTIEDGILSYVYPIDVKGVERKWRYARQSVDSIRHLLRVKQVKKRLEIELGKEYGKIKTVWQDSRYDASIYGTQIVHALVPGVHFDFPKSIWSTYDCIAPILEKRKDAVVLDFFAGSGTTGHALLVLNKQDGGRRKFILVTNNENGIAEDVCYPRLKKVIEGHPDFPEITGIDSNLCYLKTGFVRKSKNSDTMKYRITAACTDMLCLREGIFRKTIEHAAYQVFNEGSRTLAIYYSSDRSGLKELHTKLDALDGEKILYCFTLDPLGLEAEDFEDWQGVRLEPIPQKILDVYEDIHVHNT